MKTFVVTGCAGFIGSHLIEKLLSQGHNVIGIDNFDSFYSSTIKKKNLSKAKDNTNFHFYELDLSKKEQLAKLNESADVVIHLASKAGVLPSIKVPEDYIQHNIVATNNLLEWIVSHGVLKFVFASSSSVYGNNTKIPFSESDNVDFPISPYAFTKKSCELMNHTYHYLYNIDIINVRLFTVYGPRQRPDLAIHKFVKKIDEGKPIEMYGDGKTSRDYTYVEDTVNGLMKLTDYIQAHNKVFETVNLGNNKPVELKYLIQVIYKLMNKQKNIIKLPEQKGDVTITYADITKAQKMINYAPKYKIEDGVKKFIEWYYGEKH
jgi:UDP-glucuronate 4-epimerase